MTSLSDKPVIKTTLDQLAIAPENMRARDDVDDDVEGLAETLLSGQIEALKVRLGKPDDIFTYFILDGRRRYFGYQMLRDDDRIPADHPINVILCETPEEIAAASVVNNTERLPVSTADYLLAIRGMEKQFKSHDEIGKILGLKPKEVKQYATLGALDIRFLEAFKRDEINLAHLRKLTKVKKPADLEKLASRADIGDLQHNADYWISSAMSNGDAVSIDHAAARIVGLDAYIAAGGTIDHDLFEETSDKLTDTKLLLKLLVTAVKPATDVAKAANLTSWVSLEAAGRAPDGAVYLGWPFESSADKQAILSARQAADRLRKEATAHLDADDRDAWIIAIKGWMAAEIAWQELRASPLNTTDCTLYADTRGLDVHFFVSAAEFDAWKAERDEKRQAEKAEAPDEKPSPKIAIPHVETVVDTEGYQHVLHQTVTRRAGQALAATIASNPAAAFTAQLAAQFQQCALSGGEYHYGKPDRLLDITIQRAPRASGADQTFIRPIVEKLKTYVEKWQASGLHPYEWVDGLTGTDKGDLFALVTALQIETTEDKTNTLRKRTRAEAAHLAAITGHDIRDTWLPDGTFYAQFSKRQLLGFLKEMEVKTKEHDKMSREVLAQEVAIFGKNARFAPAAFDFVLVDAPEADQQNNDDADPAELDEDEDQDVNTFDDEEVPA